MGMVIEKLRLKVTLWYHGEWCSTEKLMKRSQWWLGCMWNGLRFTRRLKTIILFGYDVHEENSKGCQVLEAPIIRGRGGEVRTWTFIQYRRAKKWNLLDLVAKKKFLQNFKLIRGNYQEVKKWKMKRHGYFKIKTMKKIGLESIRLSCFRCFSSDIVLTN